MSGVMCLFFNSEVFAQVPQTKRGDQDSFMKNIRAKKRNNDLQKARQQKRGYGNKIIKVLIEKSRQLNIEKISIETGSGDFFKPARKLFGKCGFKKCEPFAHYKNDPNSCFFTIDL